MPRPKRADEAGSIYHALNRGNGRRDIFRKPSDFDAFECILKQGIERFPCEILAYQLMPNHWHMVLRPSEDGGMSSFLRWVTLTHTMRLHAHYQTGGEGHVYQGRYKSFQVQDDDHLAVVCRYVERNALRAGLVELAEQWKWGSLSRRLARSEREPTLLSPWPCARESRWRDRVNAALSEREIQAVRRSVNRGCPFGDDRWVDTVVRRLGLESTQRHRGRPRKES